MAAGSFFIWGSWGGRKVTGVSRRGHTVPGPLRNVNGAPPGCCAAGSIPGHGTDGCMPAATPRRVIEVTAARRFLDPRGERETPAGLAADGRRNDCGWSSAFGSVSLVELEVAAVDRARRDVSVRE